MSLIKKTTEVPSYPGLLVRKPTAPPKYLVQVIETEEGLKNQLIQIKGTPPKVRPSILNEPSLPIQTKLSTIIPQRDHQTPSHFYPPRQEYIPPDSKKNKTKKNRLVDIKQSSNSSINSMTNTSNKEESHTVFPALTKNPTIPRPFVPPSSSLYVGGPLMHAREASGKILGTGKKLKLIFL